MTYGDALSYISNDTETALTIDGLEAIYYTRETDSGAMYDSYSVAYFEETPSDSSESLLMDIYSDRADAALLARAIFNTIEFEDTP